MTGPMDKNIIPGLVKLQKTMETPAKYDHCAVFTYKKPTKNSGKSQFLMGKSTMSMAIFNSKLFVYQRVMARLRSNHRNDKLPEL